MFRPKGSLKKGSHSSVDNQVRSKDYVFIPMSFFSFIHLVEKYLSSIRKIIKGKSSFSNSILSARYTSMNPCEIIFLRTISICFQYQQWINNERTHLRKRIEILENENHQLSDLYFTYQVQNEKSLAAIINLILQILSTQQVTSTISLLHDMITAVYILSYTHFVFSN